MEMVCCWVHLSVATTNERINLWAPPPPLLGLSGQWGAGREKEQPPWTKRLIILSPHFCLFCFFFINIQRKLLMDHSGPARLKFEGAGVDLMIRIHYQLKVQCAIIAILSSFFLRRKSDQVLLHSPQVLQTQTWTSCPPCFSLVYLG